MTKQIDARGLQCPQPVVLAKKGLLEFNEITIIVDNEIAGKNLEKLAKSLNAEFEIKNIDENFEIKISQDGNASGDYSCKIISGKTVIVFKSEFMGSGDNELGRLLMKAYIHTIGETNIKPDMLVFYNAGVKLTVNNSDTVDDLKSLQNAGVKIIICGTCVKFYNLKNDIGLGDVSNMYDISNILLEADKIIYP